MSSRIALRRWFVALTGFRRPSWISRRGRTTPFILDSENKYDASAAVFVTMRDGAELTQKQVQGIRNFVSHSVQGLEIDNVTITDSYGNTYLRGIPLRISRICPR